GVEVKPARLVDLTIAGARYQTMKAALDILTTAPEFDLVLAAIGSSARSQPEATVRPIIDSAGAARPLAAFLVPDAPQALAMLSSAGGPNFRTPEACADAIAAALSRPPPRPPPPPAAACAHRCNGRKQRADSRRARSRCAARPSRHRTRALGCARGGHRPRAAPALRLSGRRQGAVRRDRAQDRRRRRRARSRGRRRA